MQRLFYTGLYYLLVPLLFLRLLLKHQKSSGYKETRQSLRLAERLGFFARPKFKSAEFTKAGDACPDPVWIHTVSVGEFLATLPLIEQLMKQVPQYPLVITCTTTTGSAQIIKTFADEIAQGKVFHVYLPYDLPGSMRRFMKKIRPRLGIVMETEIWPNLLTVAWQLDIPVWLLNARMSARSAKGYSHFKNLTRASLTKFAGIAAQDALDAGRLKELGADSNTLHITGSIKFDLKISPEAIEAGKKFRQQLHWQDKKVLIAASTHRGEDELLLEVYEKLKAKHPDLAMIIVPRHPERFPAVFQVLNNSRYHVLKRSQLNETVQTPMDILLGDSMGEMIPYFACADLVFMGGTLIPQGGHNILEPAALGLAIVYGPHMFNFNAINELFLQYQASVQVADIKSLEQVVNELLADKTASTAMGERARQLIEQNSGALNKMMVLLKPYLN